MLVALCCIEASCVSPRAKESASDATADTVPVVTLERGSCRGTCPVYAVKLFGDGRVQFTGTRHVNPIGVDSARVSPATVTALGEEFVRRRFGSIPAEIEYGTAACGDYATDLPTAVLTLRDAAQTHRVRFDEGCRGRPAVLDSLTKMVDAVSGSSRWTTPGKP